VVLTGANVHDVKELASALRTIVIERPEWTGVPKEHLCLDAGYYGEAALEVIVLRGYIPHVVPRGVEKQQLVREPGKKARRWVVERVFSWFNRFRKLLVRYEKKAENYPGGLISSNWLEILGSLDMCMSSQRGSLGSSLLWSIFWRRVGMNGSPGP
jgi:transposase